MAAHRAPTQRQAVDQILSGSQNPRRCLDGVRGQVLPPDLNLPYYKTVKTSLASVLKTLEKQSVISQAAVAVNRIVIRSLLFLRLYLMRHKDTPLVVNAELVDTMFKTVCQRKAMGGPHSAAAKVLRDNLTAFYKQHFELLLPIGDEPLSYTHLNIVLDYAFVQAVTVFEINIKQHFVEYVKAYVNTVWQKEYLVERIRATRKLLVNSKATEFYEGRLYNKSEKWLMQHFKETFGIPNEVVVSIGDWEQKKHHKLKEPTKGKEFRTLLRKAGYSVYLLYEFKTSCQCSHCQVEGAKCEKFRVRLDPNTKKCDEDRQLRLLHDLLLCQQCHRLRNRDVNSSTNIARLTRQTLKRRERPEYLNRQTRLPPADSAVTSTA